jgi:hypothetical protein
MATPLSSMKFPRHWRSFQSNPWTPRSYPRPWNQHLATHPAIHRTYNRNINNQDPIDCLINKVNKIQTFQKNWKRFPHSLRVTLQHFLNAINSPFNNKGFKRKLMNVQSDIQNLLTDIIIDHCKEELETTYSEIDTICTKPEVQTKPIHRVTKNSRPQPNPSPYPIPCPPSIAPTKALKNQEKVPKPKSPTRQTGPNPSPNPNTNPNPYPTPSPHSITPTNPSTPVHNPTPNPCYTVHLTPSPSPIHDPPPKPESQKNTKEAKNQVPQIISYKKNVHPWKRLKPRLPLLTKSMTPGYTPPSHDSDIFIFEDIEDWRPYRVGSLDSLASLRYWPREIYLESSPNPSICPGPFMHPTICL